MNKELFVDDTGDFVRAARYEDGVAAEFCLEDKRNVSSVGNICAARVSRVLKNGFTFVKIPGVSKDAFLRDKNADRERDGKGNYAFKQGETILVQVIKDETPQKGACVTTRISMKNMYFALIMNDGNKSGVGVSRKIEPPAERERLRDFAERLLPDNFSAVVRTEAANVSDNELEEAFAALYESLLGISEKAKYALGPAIMFKQENPLIKAVDTLLSRDISRITVPGGEAARAVYEHISLMYNRPFKEGNTEFLVRVHEQKTPVFSAYGIEPDLEKAFQKKVWLPQGGFLVIEETEAAVCIDVNSGKNVKKDYMHVVSATNREAAYEAARQIRLRNLSGLILIDFLNPKDAAETKELEGMLADALKRDRVPVKTAYTTDIGVILLTRKKTRDSLSKHRAAF